jgi:hypothetical protein
MAQCTKCGIDITSAGYDTEELILPRDTSGYSVSCKQSKTILGIVQEKYYPAKIEYEKTEILFLIQQYLSILDSK